MCIAGLSRPLLNVYPLDLGASEAQQTTIAAIVSSIALTLLHLSSWVSIHAIPIVHVSLL
jgi:hypothetical protein